VLSACIGGLPELGIYTVLYRYSSSAPGTLFEMDLLRLWPGARTSADNGLHSGSDANPPLGVGDSEYLTERLR
jgi:hypothetical protein